MWNGSSSACVVFKNYVSTHIFEWFSEWPKAENEGSSITLSPNMFDGKDNVVYNREWMLLKTKPIDTWISQGVLYLFVYPFTHTWENRSQQTV